MIGSVDRELVAPAIHPAITYYNSNEHIDEDKENEYCE